jgi:hypothetical protein
MRLTVLLFDPLCATPPDDKRGRESEEEEEVSSDERDRAGKRRKLGKKGDDSIGSVEVSPAKNTRQVHEGGRKSRNVYTLGFNGNLDIQKNNVWLCFNIVSQTINLYRDQIPIT